MRKETFCPLMIAKLILFSSEKSIFFSYWWVGDNLQNTKKLKANDKAGEGQAFGNLGITHNNRCDFHKAIKYHERDLQIAKEVGDKAEEGRAYGNLGIAYHRLSDFHKAMEYHECYLQIAKEVGDKAGEEELMEILALPIIA